jgi:hypothetical protein
VRTAKILKLGANALRARNAHDGKRLLRYRATDRLVELRVRRSLSVSSERIASTVRRCAGLRTEVQGRTGVEVDRAGGGHAVEGYPAAAALVTLGFSPDKYKGNENSAARSELLGGLCDVLQDIAPVAASTRSAY